MRVLPTALPGVLLIEPDVFRDARGSFQETWNRRRYAEAGIDVDFVQDNRSTSLGGTLRGLHLQCRRPQGKLVQAVRGTIFDVAVDVRRGSPTFGRWAGEILSAEDARQLWIPPGFAHGFCVTSREAVFLYKCTAPYDREDELAIRWDDPDLGIAWPPHPPTLSPRDAAAPFLKDVLERLPAWKAEAP